MDLKAERSYFEGSPEQVATLLETDLVLGLPLDQVSERAKTYGPNALKVGDRKNPFLMFLKQFKDLLILILIAAALVTALLGETTDFFVILGIVILNGLLGFFQEYRTEKTMQSLAKLTPQKALVQRQSGKTKSHEKQIISAADLVPGDLVFLEAGDRIPADLRLITTTNLTINESLLTGESVPILKNHQGLPKKNLALGDQVNLAFSGTFVTSGHGSGLVYAVGQKTELGKIAHLVEQGNAGLTPLQMRLNQLGRRIAAVVGVLCCLYFGFGFLRGNDPLIIFMTAISLAVAAIPEALPAVITLMLALGARRMARQKALVKSLPAVETLGSVTYICTDKTGTLTENKMQVQSLLIATPEGPSRLVLASDFKNREEPSSLALLQAMALNQNCELSREGVLLGDPTEIALAVFAQNQGLKRSELELETPRIGELPFAFNTRFMVTAHQQSEGIGKSGVQKSTLLIVKGAAEAVIKLLPPHQQQGWSDAANHLATLGLRVLLYATTETEQVKLPLELAQISQYSFQPIGLVGLEDPPRQEVAESIAKCHRAGIKVVMMTGDHPLTARGIALKTGLIHDSMSLEHQKVTLGSELDNLPDDVLTDTIHNTRVYARVNPEQKIRIVEHLQKQGEFVAMTGDGVNDAPALKRANIGIAMGLSGTDVAREASQMVLLDDHFETIVVAIKEGRRIYDNIRKFVRYSLTTNSGELGTMLLAPFFGLPIPLLPIHILWINLITDGLPGLSLIGEKGEPDIMDRPPQNPKESILARGLWQHVLWVGILLAAINIGTAAWFYFDGSPRWQTVVFTTVTLSQLGHLLGIRSRSRTIFSKDFFTNPWLLASILWAVSMQLLVIYHPTLNRIFKTTPLSISEFSLAGGFAVIVLVAVELEKRWHCRKMRLI